MSASRLEIGRVAARYLLPAEHPSPHRVKERLDAIIARDLPRTLGRAFAPWFSERDESIWIIRQLNVQAVINVTGETELISRSLTIQIGRNLEATFHSDERDNVRHFRNRAEYLASFLSDLAFGTASSQWYYESFAGLKALPVSSALRTAICDDIATGQEALASLSAQELEKVVQSFSSQDASRVLGQLASIGSAGDEINCREVVLRTAIKSKTTLASMADDWQRALYLFIAATDREKGVSGSLLENAALAIAAVKDQALNSWTGVDAQVLASSRSTAFGGLFLLVSHLDELPLVEATRDWPHADEAAAVSLLRFLVLLKCCGSEDSERAFYDPLLRDLLIIPPRLSLEALRMWQSQVNREHLKSFLENLIDWQRSRGTIGRKEQLLVISQDRGRPLLVLIDPARGLWLLVERYSPHRRRQMSASLRPWLMRLMAEEGVLYTDPSLIDLLRANFTGLDVISLSDHTIDRTGAQKAGKETILARLEKLPDDLEFLTLPRSFKLARPLDLTLTIVAQQLLRQVAHRLPGFAGSNLTYLSRNFLDFAATLEEEPARRVVHLAHPPLHLVLKMTGMNRQSYRLSWLDERPFALFDSQ